MTEVFRARWALPIEDPPIANGAIAVRDGRIAEVGPANEVAGEAVHDLGDCILLPGFVNAHTHLELSCYRGCLASGPLWEWFESLMKLIYVSGGPKPGREAVLAGAAESLAAGVTCVGDISRSGVQIEALGGSPIRKVCFLELISGAILPPRDIPSLEAKLQEADGLADPDSLVIGVSPHTLYTVVWEDLVGMGRLAARLGIPLTIHLAETADEVQWLADGSGRLAEKLARWKLPCAASNLRGRPVELLDRAGVLNLAPLLAHVNYAGDDELALLAKAPATVVWCPRSHRFFGHAPHRWREMLARGINVCVGTDSLASNQTLSILDELRYIRAQDAAVSPQLLLEMGTIRGAVGLHLGDRIGGLRPGKWADFVTVPWDSSASVDPAANLLDGGHTVSRAWIAGSPQTD